MADIYSDVVLNTLPVHACEVMSVLEAAGAEVWVVGGWVRDALMERELHDVDLTTDMPCAVVTQVLRSAGITVIETGVAHGTVTALIQREPVEVTTFRTEGAYSDKRHPDSVTFVSDIHEDLKRRDFTVNAMAWHPKRGLLDPFGGRSDLINRTIRAVGDPYERFSEDALRILRAVRFASQFEFTIDAKTQRALDAQALDLAHVANERKGIEINRILASGRAAWALTYEFSVFSSVLPELVALKGFEQHSRYHCYDVLEHTIQVVKEIETLADKEPSQALRWAALFHDIAKPACLTLDKEGQGHFYGHPYEGARTCTAIMRRLGIATPCVQLASILVRLHDYPVAAEQASCLKLLRAVDHAVANKGKVASDIDAFRALTSELVLLKRADALGKSEHYHDYADELLGVQKELDLLFAEYCAAHDEGTPPRMSWRIRDLAVTGFDLMQASGRSGGPWLGLTLKHLLDQVMSGELPNDHDALIDEARSALQNGQNTTNYTH